MNLIKNSMKEILINTAIGLGILLMYLVEGSTSFVVIMSIVYVVITYLQFKNIKDEYFEQQAELAQIKQEELDALQESDYEDDFGDMHEDMKNAMDDVFGKKGH